MSAENDNEFYALVHIKTADNLPSDFIKKKMYSLEKQMTELSNKVCKLFNNHVDGIINDQNYEMLMNVFQAEQEILEEKISILQTRISNHHNTTSSIEKLRAAVRECATVTELTPFVLNKLIAKIEIGCLEIVDNQKQQLINIKWRFQIN